MKKNNKKGFTLAELLIVVAIIAVLVAIAVPVFTAQLDKARLSTATANARSTYAEYVANCMTADPVKDPSATELEGSINSHIGVAKANAVVESGKVTVTYDGKVSMAFSIDSDVKN